MQPMPPAGPVSPGNPAMVGGILVLVCTLFLLIGTFSRSWFTAGRGDSSNSMGLVGFEFCYDGKCRGELFEAKLFDLDHGDKDITVVRAFAFLGGLASTVMLGLTGGLALARSARKAPLLGVYIVCGISLFCALLFVGRVFSEVEGRGGPDLGFSFFLTFLGYVGGILVTALMVRPAAKREGGGAPTHHYGPPGGYPVHPGAGYAGPQPYAMPAPMQQPLGAQPGAPQVGQACPRCQGQLQFAAQYQRWFCGRCQQYV